MDVLEDIVVSVVGAFWYLAVVPGAMTAPLGLGAIIAFQESRRLIPRIGVVAGDGDGGSKVLVRRDAILTRLGIVYGWKLLLWLALAVTAVVAAPISWEPTSFALIGLPFVVSWIYGDLRRDRVRHAETYGIALLVLPYAAATLAILMAGESGEWPHPFGLLDHGKFDWFGNADGVAAGKARVMLFGAVWAVIAIAGAWVLTRSSRPTVSPLLFATAGLLHLPIAWTTLPAGMVVGTGTVVMIGYALARESRVAIAAQERNAAATAAATAAASEQPSDVDVDVGGSDSAGAAAGVGAGGYGEPAARDAIDGDLSAGPAGEPVASPSDVMPDHVSESGSEPLNGRSESDLSSTVTFRYRQFGRRAVDVRQTVGIAVVVGAVWFALVGAWLWARDPLNDPESLAGVGTWVGLGLYNGAFLIVAAFLMAWNRIIIRYGALLLGFTMVSMNEALTGYAEIALIADAWLEVYSFGHMAYVAIASGALLLAMWWAFGPDAVRPPKAPETAGNASMPSARTVTDLGMEG